MLVHVSPVHFQLTKVAVYIPGNAEEERRYGIRPSNLLYSLFLSSPTCFDSV